MKKIIIYIIAFLVAVSIHIVTNTYIAPFGIAPNIALLIVIFFALSKGSRAGMWAGFLFGLVLDVLLSDMFGSRTTALTIIGYGAGLLSGEWDDSLGLNQAVLVFLCSFAYLILLVFEYSIFSTTKAGFLFNHITLLQPFFNALVAPVIFWVCKNFIKIN